jgi:hypothetical protein
MVATGLVKPIQTGAGIAVLRVSACEPGREDRLDLGRGGFLGAGLGCLDEVDGALRTADVVDLVAHVGEDVGSQWPVAGSVGGSETRLPPNLGILVTLGIE